MSGVARADPAGVDLTGRATEVAGPQLGGVPGRLVVAYVAEPGSPSAAAPAGLAERAPTGLHDAERRK